MNFARKKPSSLLFRLMIMFLVGGYVLTELMQVAVRVTVGEEIEQNIIRDTLVYAHVLVDMDSGIESQAQLIDKELAEVLAEERGFDIVIITERSTWSVGEPIDLADLDFITLDVDNFTTNRLRRVRSLGNLFRGVSKVWSGGRFVVRADFVNYKVILAFRPNIADRVQVWSIISLIGVLVLLFLTTRWLFKPLENISKVVSKIGTGDLGSRTNIKRNDEFGTLGAEINQMADDIEGMMEAKRDLFLAISHELRTPITRARVAVELIENEPTRKAIASDMKEMDSLISALAEAEEISSQHSKLNRQPCSVSQLIIKEIRAHFTDSGIVPPNQSNDDYMLLDGVRIRLLLRNLINNALRHTTLKKNIPTVVYSVSEEGLALSVNDCGEGIDKEHLGRVTEAFYRPDASRQRKTGGFGLGLYLCRNIVAAHGGTMIIESEVGIGTSVIVNIPNLCH